jgi:hypothetical protein
MCIRVLGRDHTRFSLMDEYESLHTQDESEVDKEYNHRHSVVMHNLRSYEKSDLKSKTDEVVDEFDKQFNRKFISFIRIISFILLIVNILVISIVTISYI